MTNAEFLLINSDALAEVATILGAPFTYKGISYTGVINEIEFSGELMSGGLMEGLASLILIPLGVLPNVPAVGETVKIGLKSLRVEKIKIDEIAIELVCVTASK